MITNLLFLVTTFQSPFKAAIKTHAALITFLSKALKISMNTMNTMSQIRFAQRQQLLPSKETYYWLVGIEFVTPAARNGI